MVITTITIAVTVGFEPTSYRVTPCRIPVILHDNNKEDETVGFEPTLTVAGLEPTLDHIWSGNPSLFHLLHPRQESNPHSSGRNATHYPLYYGGKINMKCFTHTLNYRPDSGRLGLEPNSLHSYSVGVLPPFPECEKLKS